MSFRFISRHLPCGIVAPPHIMPPLGTATQPEETEDKLFSASQRFTYFQEKPNQTNGRYSLKRNIRPPARFKNARMTVRLRPRQVLCSKCRGICNENSENVDLSAKKRKGTDSVQSDAPTAKLSRGDRRLRSSGEISPRPIFPDNLREQPSKNSQPNFTDAKNKKLCPSLIPKLSRLQPNEISNAMNGKVKIKIVGNYWLKNNTENDSNDNKSDNVTSLFSDNKNSIVDVTEDQDPLSISVTETSDDKNLTEPKFATAEYSLSVTQIDNIIDKENEPVVPVDVKPVDVDLEPCEEQDPLCTEDPLAILHEDGETCDADSSSSAKRVLRKKRSVGSMEDLWDETIFEDNAAKFGDKKGNIKSRTTPVIKISFGSGTGEGTVLKIPAKVQSYIPGESNEEEKKKEKTKRDASAKAAKKALKKAKKEARRKVLGSTSPVRSLGGASPRYPNLSPRYAVSCSSPRYALGGSGSPRHTLVGNSSPAYEVLHTRRHKHKVKHKKRHKEDRKHKEAETEAVVSTTEKTEDESIREQCLKQKLSISLKRLNANAYMRCDSSSSGSKSPSNSDASDASDTVPDFPGNPLMMRISSQTISSCQTSDGRSMAVGDVVWGKIHGFPWWPGKVSYVVIIIII